MAAAQAAADAATARYTEAEARHGEVVQEIEALEADIAAARDRAAILEVAVERRAVTAYKNRGGETPLAGLGDDEPSPPSAGRSCWTDASAADNAAVDELAELNDDQEAAGAASSRTGNGEAEEALAAMEAEGAAVQGELAAAQQAQAEVEEQIRQLEAAAQEAERQKQAQEEAERQAQQQRRTSELGVALTCAAERAGVGCLDHLSRSRGRCRSSTPGVTPVRRAATRAST